MGLLSYAARSRTFTVDICMQFFGHTFYLHRRRIMLPTVLASLASDSLEAKEREKDELERAYFLANISNAQNNRSSPVPMKS